MCSLQSPLFVFIFLFFFIAFNPKNNNKNKHRANATAIRICCKWNTQFTTSKSLRTLYRSSIEICSHGAKEKQKPIRYMTIHFQSLARRTGVAETSLKSSRLCVTRSLISYGFRTGPRAILPCEQRLHFRGMSWRAKSSLCRQPFSFLSCMRKIRHAIRKQLVRQICVSFAGIKIA